MEKDIISHIVKEYQEARTERFYIDPENDPAVAYIYGYVTAAGDNSYYIALTAAYIAYLKTKSFKAAKENFDLINVSLGKDLERYSHSESPIVRRKTAAVCMKYNQTIILYNLSADEDSNVRHEVLWQAIKSTPKVVPIIKIFCHDPNDFLRENAVCELKKTLENNQITEQTYHSILADVYKKEPVYNVRKNIVINALKYGFDDILDSSVSDRNENIRLLLVENGYALKQLANDKSKDVREAAQNKLNQIERNVNNDN